MKYRYIGTETKNLPKYSITVSNNGEIIETDKEINHPEFKLIDESSEQVQTDTTAAKTKSKKQS